MQCISALVTEAQSAVPARTVLQAASKFIHENLPRLNGTAASIEAICKKVWRLREEAIKWR